MFLYTWCVSRLFLYFASDEMHYEPKRSTGYNYNELQAHYKLHSRLFDDDEYYNRLRVHMSQSRRLCAFMTSVIYGYCHWSIIFTLNKFPSQFAIRNHFFDLKHFYELMIESLKWFLNETIDSVASSSMTENMMQRDKLPVLLKISSATCAITERGFMQSTVLAVHVLMLSSPTVQCH